MTLMRGCKRMPSVETCMDNQEHAFYFVTIAAAPDGYATENTLGVRKRAYEARE